MHFRRRLNFSQSVRMAYQAGIVLFFALLALVVMSIAAVALIRSVDTNNLLSGNLVFRQSASPASNVALEVITAYISQNLPLANNSVNNPSLGYYANCIHFDTTPANQVCDGGTLTSMTWSDANSQLVPTQVDGNAEISGGMDRQGNQIRYIVERMCNYNDAELATANTATDANRCMMASAATNGQTCSHSQTNLELFKQCVTSPDTPLYRVTLQIAGPKNTMSYMQTFISN